MQPSYGAVRRAGRRALRPWVLRARQRSLRPADVMLASYPRSGNTWLRVMIAELLAGGRELQFEDVPSFVPRLGEQRAAHAPLRANGRVVRLHERWHPDYRRGVYVVRDPRDVLVSYWHWYAWARDRPVNLDEFVRLFWQPFALNSYGTWDANVHSWLRARNGDAEVLVVRYEDIHADAAGRLGEIARFLGIPASSSELGRVAEANSVPRMREKERRSLGAVRAEVGGGGSAPGLVRTGQVGTWRATLTRKQSALPHAARVLATELGYPRE